MSKKLSKNGFAVGIALVVFGLYWTYGVYQRAALVKACQNWPSVTGKVVSAEVRTRTRTSRKKKHRARSRRKVSCSAIKYAYDVNGQSYTNDRLSFVGSHSGKEAAQACVAKYAPDTEVQVYYDPEEPAQAVLERDSMITKGDYLLPGGAMVIAGAVIIALKVVAKSRE